MLPDFTNSWKVFLPPAGLGSVFPAKNCRDAWSGSRLARGLENVVAEARLCRPICSIFEELVVCHAVGRCRGQELCQLYWPICTAYIAVFGVAHWFAEYISQK